MTRGLAGIACAMALLVAVPALPQSASAAKPDPDSPDRIPLEIYNGPRPKNLDEPDFPMGQFGDEGWVRFAMMVDRQGKPFDITIIDSTGNRKFEEVAMRSLERSRFEPGTLDGQPVEAGFELKYQFQMDNHPAGARMEFIRAFKKLIAAIKANDRAAADAVMGALKVTNLYEDTYYGMALYSYATAWGDDSERLRGLRRAIAFEDSPKYLAKDEYRSALLECMRLELKTHQYAEALSTGKKLQKTGLDAATADSIKVAVGKLEKIRTDESSYDVAGEISDRNWFLHLFKAHFRAIVSDGYISEARLRCDRSYRFFAFDASLQYQVDSRNHECSIELLGAPGTHFRFVQF